MGQESENTMCREWYGNALKDLEWTKWESINTLEKPSVGCQAVKLYSATLLFLPLLYIDSKTLYTSLSNVESILVSIILPDIQEVLLHVLTTTLAGTLSGMGTFTVYILASKPLPGSPLRHWVIQSSSSVYLLMNNVKNRIFHWVIHMLG